jgi:hypothetical protein
MLAQLGWERCPPSGADVVLVGEPRVGRAIAYRQSQFGYESVIPLAQDTMEFSTAAAALRFMIMEHGHVLRLHLRL